MWKMSNVRLSNGSPTLERVDARQTDHAKPPVRRNLFGSVDREEFKRDCIEQLQETERAAAEKWNFDFSKNEPLTGKFVWKEVDGKQMPDFYTRPHHKRSSSSGNLDHNGNHDYPLTTTTPPENGGHSEDTVESQLDCREPRTAPRKRHASQESSCQSKRSHTSSKEVNHSPDLTHSVEQTPSKSNPRT